MQHVEIPTREFTLDYPMPRLKESLVAINESVKNAGFRISKDGINDIFNTISYHVFKGDSIVGLISGDFMISLQPIDEQKTKLIFTGQAAAGNQFNAQKIYEMQDYLMKLISKELTGTLDAQAELQNNAGCLTVVVVFIVSSVLTYMLW